nr:protein DETOXIFICATION 37-like [Coffea arabica]
MESTPENEFNQTLLEQKRSMLEEVSSELEDVLSDTSLSRCQRLWRAVGIEIKTLFRLAAPACVVYLLNNVVSMSTQIFCGHLGNIQLAASSLGNTGDKVVRVGNELGAGNPKSAAFAVFMVNFVSFVVAVVEAIIVLSLRHVISYAFTSGETVANAVSDLCPFLAVTLILNGVQPVLSGVAVGCGWQAYVAYVNVGCYYVVGIPLGCLLGFKYKLGAKGIWSGMIGGTMMQTLILVWSTFRTDWNKEVEKARERLRTWDDKQEPLLKE